MPYAQIGELALWTSDEGKRHDYQGKMQLDVQEDDRKEYLVFLSKQSSTTMSGSGAVKTDEGLDFVYDVTVTVNQSENEKAPLLKGTVSFKNEPTKVGEIALWKVNSDNPKAPVFSGKITQKQKEKEPETAGLPF